MAADMADRHRLLFFGVPALHVGNSVAHLRRRLGQGHASVGALGGRLPRLLSAERSLQGQHVGPQASGDLFGQRVVLRASKDAVQRPRDFGDPVVVEVMKDARLNAGPIMDRHGMSSVGAR